MSPKRLKAPRKPPQQLRLGAGDVAVWSGPLWRIHRVAGRHASAWNEPRAFGPISTSRWDPHPLPRQQHTVSSSPFQGATPGVAYAASNPDTAFAEVFQERGIITLSPHLALTGWEPARGLELLDLAHGDFAIRNGASYALTSAPRSTCRAWARAIWEQHGNSIAGLLTPSTMTGDPVIVLFPMARSMFPAAPGFSRTLNHVDVARLALHAGRRFGWPVVA